MKHKSKKWMLQTKRADFRKISEKFGISPVLREKLEITYRQTGGSCIRRGFLKTWRRRCRFCGKIEKN